MYPKDMFEFINLTTGQSAFATCELFTVFSIPRHLLVDKTLERKLTPTAKHYIEAQINSGAPAAWYNGVYVRRIEAK